jgi:hypothetical protein
VVVEPATAAAGIDVPSYFFERKLPVHKKLKLAL